MVAPVTIVDSPSGVRSPVRGLGVVVAACAIAFAPARLLAQDPPPRALELEEVLDSVMTRYPPLLAALIEKDITSGRVRQAEGAFDLTLNAGANAVPSGYYDGRTGSVILEQALQSWGAKVYGGDRLSSGLLPNYNLQRTPEDGQVTAGIRLSLLRQGRIDRERATREQSRIDAELADPFIARQRLEFTRAATISYFNWVNAGFRLRAAEELLRLANDRDTAIGEQVRRGALAPIVRIDNERLVVSRRLATIQNQRRFEAATIELSLFLRDPHDQPVLANRKRLPPAFPAPRPQDPARLSQDTTDALARRPELRNIALSIDRVRIETDLARNDLLPNLDLTLEARQSPTQRRLSDIEPLETRAGVELRIPLQRREASGRLQVAESQIRRLQADEQFARDRIGAEVRDTFSALSAATGQITQAQRNVVLAVMLEDAERLRFRQGASDLLALQIREQATFDARLGEVDAFSDYFRALANYRAATGNTTREGARSP